MTGGSPVRALNLPAGFLGVATRLSASTLLANLILVGALPLLSRLFGPEDFGVYAFIASIAAVATGASMLRLEIAILSARRPQVADRLLATAVLILPVSTALVAVVCFIFTPEDPAWPAPWLAALCVACLVGAAGLAQAVRNWTLARDRVDSVMTATLLNAAGRSFGQLGLAVPIGGATALVLGDCFGRLLSVASLVRGRWRRLRRLAPLIGRIASTLREHRRFVLFGTPSALLDALGYALLIPAVTYAFGALEAGLVAMAVRLLSVPAQVASGNIGDALQRELTARVAHGHAATQAYLRRWMLRLLAAAVVLVVPIAVVCGMFADLILGVQWAALGSVAPWLAVQWILAFAIAPASRVLLVGDGQREKLLYDLLAAIVPLVLLLSQVPHGLERAVAAYVIGHAATYVLYAVLIDRCAARLDRRGA